MKRITTIGAYGFTESGFITALRAAGVDTFVDVRQRRGMRGARYAFLNSRRLQDLLRASGLNYVYAPELAPSTRVRDAQREADSDSATTKRGRIELSPVFVSRYKSEVLAGVDFAAFEHRVKDAAVIALFCVEGNPAACHRSIAAAYLAAQYGLEMPVKHLTP